MPKLYLVKLAKAEKIAKSSILKLIVIIAVKILAAQLTGMVILYTSALKSFTTVLSVFASYVGIKASQKTADQHFEYGYYKVETFAAFIASVLILYLGGRIFVDNIDNLIHPEEYNYGLVGIVVVIFSLIFSWKFSNKLEKAAKEANLSSLLVSAKYKKIDFLASVGVIIGAFTVLLGANYIEPILSAIIAVTIVVISLKTFKHSLFSLLDYWWDTNLMNQVKEILNRDKHIVQKIESVKLRQAGPLIFGESILRINPFANIKDVRNTVANIKLSILKLSPYLQDFSIYSKVVCPEKTVFAIPVILDDGLKSLVAHSWNKITKILIIEINDQKVRIKNSLNYKKTTSHQELIRMLVKNKVNIFMSAEIDSLTYYTLERINQIQLYPAFSNAKTVEEAIKLFTIDK